MQVRGNFISHSINVFVCVQLAGILVHASKDLGVYLI